LSPLYIREFDLIQIFQQHFDWNSLNRIQKSKNLNIQIKIYYPQELNNSFKFRVSILRMKTFRRFKLHPFLEELGATFFPTEAWGQPLTFDFASAGLHHPALLHTTLHGPPMVSSLSSILNR
jgi:hypothetical protein